ncbi:hypothetical protein TNCV_466001 [Trichonephila clavipes]|nr:hypothetical protein TNCV_466001 [Trichonephila clavipes]
MVYEKNTVNNDECMMMQDEAQEHSYAHVRSWIRRGTTVVYDRGRQNGGPWTTSGLREDFAGPGPQKNVEPLVMAPKNVVKVNTFFLVNK